MVPQRFKPNSRYLYKLLVVYTAVALLILAGILLLGGLISLDDGRVGLIIIAIMLPLNFIWWICAMILAFPYYRSLEYEVLDDEVIVRVGIFTHSVKAHRQVDGGQMFGQCADGNIVHTGFCIGPNIIQRDVA